MLIPVILLFSEHVISVEWLIDGLEWMREYSANLFTLNHSGWTDLFHSHWQFIVEAYIVIYSVLCAFVKLSTHYTIADIVSEIF